MREIKKSKAKPKQWMVEKEASERFDETVTKGFNKSRKVAKIYKIKSQGIEFEEHRITPRDYFTNKWRRRLIKKGLVHY